MPSRKKKNTGPPKPPPVDEAAVREILGYLNFSNGTPDAGFQRNLNRLSASLAGKALAVRLRDLLQAGLKQLERESPAFAESTQAAAAVRLALDECLLAYRRHHADLLFHLSDAEVEQPFFLARLFEAVLAQGPPWDETERIVQGTLDRLNDFIGFRPLVVLENNRQMQPYSHERFRPVPFYIRDAGVAVGRYHELIERTIEFLRGAPADLLHEAHFDLARMDELAVDVRAHDHLHPVNKRTNYMFGEWDPHHIDTKGYYRRFVVRKVILDSLLAWMDQAKGAPREELLYDAAAVLCGTILMASSISGAGPDTHDSSVTLSSLLPRVARQRDAFYERLLREAEGTRAKRLRREAKLTQQPFGHVRQHLNIELAKYGARQVQYRHLAQLYARMGYPEASRDQATIIPCASARIECEIGWRLTSAHRHLDRGETADSLRLIREAEDYLHCGIECGAVVDPWNILGFQGQFPLFTSREDAVPDPRVDVLLDFMGATFDVYARTLSEAAAQGEKVLVEETSEGFRKLADWWDRFATTTVEELPKVTGHEIWESAVRVSDVLGQWRAAGEAAGDISFWRQHVEQFSSAAAYAQVVETLLEKQDHIAAMGLLMQWLSQADEVGLEAGPHSIHTLLVRWMNLAVSGNGRGTSPLTKGGQGGFGTPSASAPPPTPPHEGGERLAGWPVLRRLFDYLEANAGPYWSVPTLDQATMGVAMDGFDDEDLAEEFEDLFDEEFDESEDDEQLFGAAYDGVVYRDSAMDGIAEDTLEGGYLPENTEFELIAHQLEPRLKFINTLAQLWQLAGATLAARSGTGIPPLAPNAAPPLTKGGPGGVGSLSASGPPPTPPYQGGESAREQIAVIEGWRDRVRTLQQQLIALMNAASEYEIATSPGDYDSNIEYDMQLQAKFYLLHTIMAACINCRTAERVLLSCLPAQRGEQGARDNQLFGEIYRAVLRRDTVEVRRLVPRVLKRLSRQPLLYVSLENGGDPRQILAARDLQTVITFLLIQLPKLGLLRETWQLISTAYRMERVSRPDGMAVTEFDRLLRIALKGTLECVVRSSATWRQPDRLGAEPVPDPNLRRRQPRVRQAGRKQRRPRADRRAVLAPDRRIGEPVDRRRSPIAERPERTGQRRRKGGRDRELIDLLSEIVEPYLKLWLKHSRTVRLSPVEFLQQEGLWSDVKDFVSRYGADLFHARMLMLSNVRAILHHGIDDFLEYLAEEEDPLHPIALLDDLENGVADREQAVRYMELIYESVVDKLDRFIEYNTTTTQSDYGDMFYTLLDFLRVEVAYDRDAWNLIPVSLVHEALAQFGRHGAMGIWERIFDEKSGPMADRHLKRLRDLERQYGMRLPSIGDRMSERFTKPLAVNRMQALVPRAVEDARSGRQSSKAFEDLRNEIEQYLETTSGSAIDIPQWLRALEKEVNQADARWQARRYDRPAEFEIEPVLLRRRQLEHELRAWPGGTRRPA